MVLCAVLVLPILVLRLLLSIRIGVTVASVVARRIGATVLASWSASTAGWVAVLLGWWLAVRHGNGRCLVTKDEVSSKE